MERNENYFVWLFNQLKGWPMQNYLLFFLCPGLSAGFADQQQGYVGHADYVYRHDLGDAMRIGHQCYQGDQWLAGADLGCLLYLRGFGSKKLPVDF